MNKNIHIKHYMKNNELDLEEIINDYSAYVSKIIDNMSKGFIKEADKEEIVLDVFFILWKNTNKLDKNKNLSPYLAGITRNVVRTYFSNNKIQFDDLSDYENTLYLLDDSKYLDENYYLILRIEKKLKSMKKIDKDIFIDFYYSSESIKDIAKKYRMSEFSVKQRLYRIRKKIKKETQINE